MPINLPGNRREDAVLDMLHKTTEEERHRAALYICGQATGVEDAANLIQMLGLMPDEQPEEESLMGPRGGMRRRAKPGRRQLRGFLQSN